MSDINAEIRVTASARLHLGFLDPSASRGRQYGSVGLSLDAPNTRVSVAPSSTLEFHGEVDQRVRDIALKVLNHYALPAQLSISVDSQIPAHAGLGSGTQLALALASAITRFFALRVSTNELASAMSRGKRSGIGLKLFDYGGIIVDAGHGPSTVTPPLIARYDFPDDWRVVLIFDRRRHGLNGSEEVKAFGALPPFPRAQAAELCHLTLMSLMPAVLEHDFVEFASSVGQIQAMVGDYFTSAQSGRFSSPAVAEAMAVCSDELGLAGIGQSSWGPTSFVFVPDEASADSAIATLNSRLADYGELEFRSYQARNCGANLLQGDKS